jgi:hypothetical protein
MNGSSTAVPALQARRERFEKAREHEGQRLEPVDRPLQLDRRFEALFRLCRNERAYILTASPRLPDEPLLTETGSKFSRG